MIKQIFLLIWFVIALWPDLAKAQTISTTVENRSSCSNQISVPITVKNFNGVSAISLKLNYNSTHLVYNGYQNLHPALSSGLLLINAINQQIVITWANTSSVNIGNDTLVWLNFTASIGTSTLSWDTQTPGNCEYSDINGNILTSSFTNGNITLHQLPQINTHPIDKTVLNSHSTSFSVSATGTGLTYRWQVSTDNGNTFTNLSNSSPYSGTTSNTLNINNASLAMNGFKYRCQITGTCPPILFSNNANLEVIEPVIISLPSITTCPDTVVVPINVNNFTDIGAFSLVLNYNTSLNNFIGFQNVNTALSVGNFASNTSGGKIYISWASLNPVTFGNGSLVELLFITNSGNATLSWDNQLPGNCEFTSGNGQIRNSIFNNGSITTHLIPNLTSQPANRTIAMSQNTTFSISATGTGLSYRWQVSTDGGLSYTDLTNGGHYSGTTTTNLSVNNAATNLSGNKYRCRISGTCQPIIFSSEANLTVLTNIFTSCQSLTTCPGDVVVAITISEFSDIAALSLALGFNSNVLTFTGYQNLHPSLNGGLFTANASGDKILISWTHTQAASIPNNSTLIELKFSSLPGTSALTWDTQTPGYCEYSMLNGQVVYSTWTNGSLTLRQPPIINTQPIDKSIYGGGTTNFSLNASGAGLGYQWQLSIDDGISWQNLTNVAPYSGVTTSNLIINPAIESMNGNKYRCYVTGTCTPFQYSNPATLTVTTTAILTHILNTNSSCAGIASVPINVTNCNNVGSISLVLNYDSTKLTYIDYHSVNPELNSGLLIINNTGNKIFISWASTTPINISNDILLRLRFAANIGTNTSLTWDTQTSGNCEYSNPLGNIITSLYYNGNVNLNTNYPVYNQNTTAAICSGDTFIFGTQLLTNSGVYTEIFKSKHGCDSTVNLTLTVHPSPTIICNSDTSVCINNIPFTLQGASPSGGFYTGTAVNSGIFSPSIAGLGSHALTYSFTDANQCTNSCNFTVIVQNLPVVNCPPNFNISINAPPYNLSGGMPIGGTFSGNGVNTNVFFPSQVSTGNTTLSYTFQDPITLCYNTCDFIAYVYDPSMVSCSQGFTICSNDPPIILNQGNPPGGTYSGQGISGSTFDPSIAGPGQHLISYNYDDGLTIGQCNFNIIVKNPFESSENLTICLGDTLFWRGKTLTSGGTYFDSLVTANNCDSVYILYLSVNQSYKFIQNHAICQGQTLSWRGNSFSIGGTYYDSLQTAQNCDSIYVLNLTVNPTYLFSENQAICQGQTLSWRGNSYSIAGTYYDSLQTAQNCDSIYVLILTVNPTYLFSENQAICQGQTYSWRGNSYTIAGTYYDSLQTAQNCDSIFVLNLTVNPTYLFSENQAICQGQTFSWRGNSYSIAGTYYDSLQTAQNCDSIFVLNLTVNPTYLFSENQAICQGQTFSWRGNSYSIAGTYYDSLQTTQNCDSIYVLNLTVNPTYLFSENQAICQGQTYSWRGNSYTIAGTYYDSLQTVQNCDSIYVLNLTITPVDTSVTQAGIELTANAINATFQWIDCGNNNAIIPGANSNIFTATANGLYAVIVTQNNCSDTSSCYNITTVNSLKISNPDKLRVYPNPSKGDFIIEAVEQTEVRIYDAIGKLKLQQTLYEGKNEINLTNMAVGVYYIKAESRTLTETIKIVIYK